MILVEKKRTFQRRGTQSYDCAKFIQPSIGTEKVTTNPTLLISIYNIGIPTNIPAIAVKRLTG